MSRSDLIELVDAQVIAGKLMSGRSDAGWGYLAMNLTTLNLLFNHVFEDYQLVGSYYSWRETPIHVRKSLPDFVVEPRLGWER